MKRADLKGRGIIGGPKTAGRKSAVLSREDHRRLVRYRMTRERELHVYIGIPELKRSMNAPFSWETLKRAIEGEPISIEFHDWLVQFLDEQDAQSNLPFHRGTVRNGGEGAGQGRGGGSFSAQEAMRRGSR